MVQILQQRDIGGDIGRAFGAGLSEQLPKEIQSKRLSAAYQRMKSMQEKGEPVDISEFIGIPGGLEAIPSIQGYINRSILAGKKPQMGEQGITATPKQLEIASQIKRPEQDLGIVIPSMPKPEAQPQQETFFKSPETIALMSQGELKDPSAEIARLSQEAAAKGVPYAEAEAYYESQLGRPYKAQQKNIQDSISKSEEVIKDILQSSGLENYEKLEGKIVQSVKSLVRARAIMGEQPEQIAQSLIEPLNLLSKDLVKLQQGDQYGSNVKEDIINAFDNMKKLGLERRAIPLFAEIYKVSPSTIAGIVDPLTNKEIISLTPQRSQVTTKLRGGLFKDTTDYDKIAKSIKSTDNIMSIMDRLAANGYDPSKLKAAINRNKSIKDKISKNPKQNEQLSEPMPGWQDAMKNRWFRFVHEG